MASVFQGLPTELTRRVAPPTKDAIFGPLGGQFGTLGGIFGTLDGRFGTLDNSIRNT